MSLQGTFRLSFYLSLALACCCLASAELYFLNWMGIFLAVILGIIAFAFFAEGRWSLSLAASNRLGLVIAIGAFAWIYYNIPHSEDDLIAGGVPWPAGLLPLLGPLLVVLLLAKLFRFKQIPDFWALQTV